MRKSIIVAMDQNNGIGYRGRLPWHLPAELKNLKALSMGHHLIMGRKTFDSIGKPLPGRTTIIVTRNPNYHTEGCLVAHSIPEAFKMAKANGESEVFIFGGHEIYQEALKETDRLYLTRVHSGFQVDAFFPNFDFANWEEISAVFHPADKKNPYPFTIFIYERRS